MIREFSTPSPELAGRLLRDVPYARMLVGYEMHQMSGNTQVALFSLEDVVQFMKAPKVEALLRVGSRASIAYVHADALIRWVAEALADPALAQRLRAAVDASDSYVAGVRAMQPILQERLDQCRAVAAATESLSGVG